MRPLKRIEVNVNERDLDSLWRRTMTMTSTEKKRMGLKKKMQKLKLKRMQNPTNTKKEEEEEEEEEVVLLEKGVRVPLKMNRMDLIVRVLPLLLPLRVLVDPEEEEERKDLNLDLLRNVVVALLPPKGKVQTRQRDPFRVITFLLRLGRNVESYSDDLMISRDTRRRFMERRWEERSYHLVKRKNGSVESVEERSRGKMPC